MRAMTINTKTRLFTTCDTIAAISFFIGIGLAPYLWNMGQHFAIMAIIFALPGLRFGFTELNKCGLYLRIFLINLAALMLIVFLNILFGRVEISEINLLLYYPAMVLVAMAIIRSSTSHKLGVLTVVTGFSFFHAGGMALTSIVQVYFFDIPRAHGSINAVTFAQTFTLTGGIVTIYLFQKVEISPTAKKILGLAGALFVLIFTLSLTGTRGAQLVIFPFIIGLVCFNLFSDCSHKWRVNLVLAIALVFQVFLASGASNMGLIRPELEKVFGDASVFDRLFNSRSVIDNRNSATELGSVGDRIEMWTAATALIKSRPIAGHGFLDFRELAEIPPEISTNYDHAHNQYLELWMKGGIIGIIFFLIYLGLPIWAGARTIKNSGGRLLGMNLIWIGGSFSVLTLTDVFLLYPETAPLVGVFLVMLLSEADRNGSST